MHFQGVVPIQWTQGVSTGILQGGPYLGLPPSRGGEQPSRVGPRKKSLKYFYFLSHKNAIKKIQTTITILCKLLHCTGKV